MNSYMIKSLINVGVTGFCFFEALYIMLFNAEFEWLSFVLIIFGLYFCVVAWIYWLLYLRDWSKDAKNKGEVI
jgi:amino acid permease